MIDQASAILRLLDDDEQETVRLVKEKLEEVSSVSALRSLRAEASDRAAEHLDDLIQCLLQRDADERFAELCRSFPATGEVEEASWLLEPRFARGRTSRRFRKNWMNGGRDCASGWLGWQIPRRRSLHSPAS